jgi:plasmid stabilization system protein ParE
VNLRVHESAERELLEAAEWYEDRQSGLGEQFVDEYQLAMLRILAAPESFGRLETTRTRRNIRRCFLKRFSYYVAYELKSDEILVLAVAHTKRRPNNFLRRR